MSVSERSVTCAEVRDHLADLADGLGSSAMRQHVVACAACTRLVHDSALVHRALRELPPVRLSGDFEPALEKRLAVLAPPRAGAPGWHRAVWPARIGGFALAGVAVALAILWLGYSRAASVDVEQRQLVSVEVEVQVAAPTPGARMSVVLPSGLEIASANDELTKMRAVEWTADLTPGSNRFTLVLLAASVGKQRLRVSLAAGGDRAEMELEVRVHAGAAHASAWDWHFGLAAAAPRLRLELGGRS